MQSTNPYKGLFPYTSEDEPYFFGRDAETADMLEMIRNKQLGILYGESGSGKTSLINAKLFPHLKRAYYFPIYIRLNFLSKVDPMTQVREKMYEQLSQWDKNAPVFPEDMSLIEFAGRYTFFDGLVRPILFFDQFEELFTLGQKYVTPASIDRFLEQLADVIELRIPAAQNIVQSQAANSNTSVLSRVDSFRDNVSNYTIVFSLRQDYIGQLDDLRFKIPSIIYNRYRIRKFNDVKAKEAILGPARVFAKNFLMQSPDFEIVNEETADEIIVQLKRNEKGDEKKTATGPNYNIEIDPTILSLYCQQLYEEATADNAGLKQITIEQVRKYPCNKIIENYYNKSISSRKIKTATERMLITPDGKRTLVLLNDFAERSRIPEETILMLKQKSGIYRIYGEGEEMEIELAHDQIAKRALKNRKIREANRFMHGV